MNIEVVIGANYGDEGKGLFTEYLSTKHDNSIVVLVNGGCQRGHTVNDPKYGKHVFHHFGAGTFRNRPTYFMHTFLLNPMQFMKEYNELVELGVTPVCYRHPDCNFQIPVDIFLNRHHETELGELRNGSVGSGIWESCRRINIGKEYNFTFNKFLKLPYKQKVDFLKNVSYRYVKTQITNSATAELELLDMFMSDGFVNHFISDMLSMEKLCKQMDETELNQSFDTAIIEQGQGLGLDPAYTYDIAHTTPSNPGVLSISGLINHGYIKPDIVNINYISRSYLTRHGAGELENEIVNHTIGTDLTNIENEWQGKLRYGLIDARQLKARIDQDFDMIYHNPHIRQCSMKVVFTHLNEFSLNSELMSLASYVSSSDKADEIITKI